MADGFEMLAEDHRAVERLFETYVHDNEDSVAREICEELTLHTQVEEAALYPALRRYVDGGDDLADDRRTGARRGEEPDRPDLRVATRRAPRSGQ